MKNEKITLRPTGASPIRFSGIQIASDTSRDHNSFRWTDIVVYRTASGKYVTKVSGITSYQGEQDYHKVTVCETAADAIESLKNDEGTIGRIAQRVIEECAKTDSAWEQAWVKDID